MRAAAGAAAGAAAAAAGAAQQVAPCGLSGPDDPALRALYEEAFRAG